MSLLLALQGTPPEEDDVIQAIRVAIADIIRAGVTLTPALICTPYVSDAITVPHLQVGEVDIDVNNAMGAGGYDVYRFVVRAYTSRADDKSGQALLDQLVSRTGPGSIRRALNASRQPPGTAELNGTCDDFSIERVQGYRLYQFGDEMHQYYGAEIIIRVIGLREGLS